MSLFNLKRVTLHSGDESEWIIDCEALTDDDLKTLAFIAAQKVGEFGVVYPIPRGGYRFAQALIPYITPSSGTVLIADDVLTTGSSMLIAMGRIVAPAKGVVIYARGELPPGVEACWRL